MMFFSIRTFGEAVDRVRGFLRWYRWCQCYLWTALLLGSLGGSVMGQDLAEAPAPIQVREIIVRHVGPASVSDNLVRGNLRLKPQDVYQRTRVDEDVRSLYNTGYFYNVRVLEDFADNGVILTYVVQGKPTLTDIQFSGNKKFSRKRLLKKVTSQIGEPLDEPKLFADTRAILENYQKAGLQKTEVKYVLNINENLGQGSVVFEITESPKIKIEDVIFDGATEFKQSKLRRTVKTRRHWFLSWLTGSGKVKEEELEDDYMRLAEFYREKGYIDFNVEDVTVDYPKPNRSIVHFKIFEGDQYRVGDLRFEGNTLFPTEELLLKPERKKQVPRLELNVGDVFTPKGLERDTKEVRDVYESAGYLTTRNEGETEIEAVQVPNLDANTIDLNYKITEGPKSYIEQIIIKGNTKTKDRVIRRELAVTPGEPFNMVRVDISKQRLEGMNYFSKVETKVEPTAVPDRKNLVIAVEEQNTGNFNIGAGFSSVDDIVGFAEVTQGNFDLFNPPNFTGGGQKFRLRVQLGTRRQDYILTFVEPFFLNQRLAFQTDLYHREQDFLSDIYRQTQTGIRLGLTKQLPKRFEAGVNYTFERVDIDFDNDEKSTRFFTQDIPGRGQTIITRPPQISQELLAEEGARLVSKVGALLAYDTRGAGFLPNSGQRTELLAELAGGPFGADTDFYSLELRTAWYFKGFFTGHVLEIAGRGGVVEEYGQSNRVPLFDRWFLGGLYDLRGFRFRDVGPKDEFEEPLGGSTYWFASAEYSLPIIERLRFAIFYDMGNVYQDAYSFKRGDLFNQPTYYDNWGVGIRLNIPGMGPLRLDYAIPISHDDTHGGSGRFQFGVSYTRF